MLRYLFFVILFVCFFANAQEKLFPLNLSFINESTAIPFTRFFTFPVHPGVQIGTEFNYRDNSKIRIFQTANICYFYHKYLNHGIGINSELGYEYRVKSGFAFSGLLGIGYMHTIATAEEYVLVNGQYLPKSDNGNSRLYPSLSLEAGYYFGKEKNDGIKIFTRYQAWAEYPYSPGFIPILSHVNFHAGVKCLIKCKSEK